MLDFIFVWEKMEFLNTVFMGKLIPTWLERGVRYSHICRGKAGQTRDANLYNTE